MEMMGLDSEVLEQLYKLCSTRLCANTLGQVHRWKGGGGGGGREKEREGDGGGSYRSACGEESLISHSAWVLTTGSLVHLLAPIFDCFQVYKY